MKLQYIPLTQGQYARVDEKNWARLMKYNWCARYDIHTKSFYAVRAKKLPNGKQTPVSMHREVLGLKRGDKQQADHLSHDTLDNRECNLRIVTHQENNHNTIGRGYYKNGNRWQAECYTANITVYLGVYPLDQEILAAASYIFAKQVIHPTAPYKRIFRDYCKRYGWDKHDLRQAMNRVEKKTLQHITRHKAKHP